MVKMGFKKKSAYAGTCKKDQTHSWNINDEVFMQKKDDGNWIICNNEECFKSQGGTIEEAKQKFQASKFPISDAIKLYELSESILTSFQNKRKDQKLPIEEQAVFVESIFKTLSQGFKP